MSFTLRAPPTPGIAGITQKNVVPEQIARTCYTSKVICGSIRPLQLQLTKTVRPTGAVSARRRTFRLTRHAAESANAGGPDGSSSTGDVQVAPSTKEAFEIHKLLDAGLGSVMLVAATVLSLFLANSKVAASYLHFWHTSVGPAALGLAMPIHHWVNEFLMAFFFFLVGLEIKKEFVSGSLRSLSKAILPCLGALGGMVVPMAIYFMLNLGAHGVPSGWAIPMATDIAFAMAIYGFFRHRMPGGVAAFLLTLATVDDLGAIAVIAVFFAKQISFQYLGAAVALCAALYHLQSQDAQGVQNLPVFASLGLLLWYCLLQGGINADIAGVATAMAIPSKSPVPEGSPVHEAHDGGAPVLMDHLIYKFTPWAALFIMPVFALANCAVPVDLTVLGSLIQAPVAHGIAAGLLLGKPIGITAFSLLGIKLGIASWPTGMTQKHLLTVGLLGGIGFTMSLFLIEQSLFGVTANIAKLAILLTSAAAALLGAGVMSTFETHDPSKTQTTGAWTEG
ncbi:hypothetical protein CYMTET_8004 [Cymbomonas tetramitiformis]|uniref:Na+/H+ antiporter NhaA n=1 Tax=Cymbomonas tetramitiformis TaxID=36881 RepID=A0AAE0LGI4_9CHLO|nr:hypothetical protein CYMTET_8004 [Cymbomonas tetramitiformis]